MRVIYAGTKNAMVEAKKLAEEHGFDYAVIKGVDEAGEFLYWVEEAEAAENNYWPDDIVIYTDSPYYEEVLKGEGV